MRKRVRHAPLREPHVLEYLATEDGKNYVERLRRRGQPQFSGQTVADRIRYHIMDTLDKMPPPTYKEIARLASTPENSVNPASVQTTEKRMSEDMWQFNRARKMIR